FTSILQADPKTHFSGKKYLAFDTIYTSTQRNTSDDPAQLLKNDSEVIVYAIQNEDFSSAFYSRKGWFIYRTYIPEPAYKQTVIIDIAGSDSAMIAGYFYSGETKKIIK
ncbi:MAG: hypothetical protein IH598_08250, partial [Bacteroidales bacterium]|nr:hypothetical protein [Bacteroidales bacterium]